LDKAKNLLGQKTKTKVVLLSAKGKTWNQQLARDFSKLDRVIFICGRYEGVDE
jgi:tRNA (guanine37-N1)-methyltransferase